MCRQQVLKNTAMADMQAMRPGAAQGRAHIWGRHVSAAFDRTRFQQILASVRLKKMPRSIKAYSSRFKTSLSFKQPACCYRILTPDVLE